EAPTFLFVRGNDKNALTDDPINPAVPALVGEIPFTIEPLQLPQASWQPGSVKFIRDDVLAACQKEVEKATAAISTATSKFEEAVKNSVDSSSNPGPRTPSPESAV